MELVSMIATASEIANSQVVWSILCIILAVYVLRKSSILQERLLANLDSFSRSQNMQAQAMEKISENLKTVEQRMDRMERHIYISSSTRVNE